MNSAIENAFAAWLVTAGITAPVHTGASAEEFDPEQLAVIVAVPDVEHTVGPLHRATVNLVVSGPAYHATVQSYRETATSVRALMDDHSTNGLASVLDAEAGLGLGGLWVKDSSERVEEDRWIHTLALTVGLVRPV
jgi:hypothetical protein